MIRVAQGDPDRSGVVTRRNKDFSGPYYYDSRHELPNPGAARCWCDRCRLALGNVRGATHAANAMFMVCGSNPMLVSLVCAGCLRPDDVVLMRGGSLHNSNRMREAKERNATAASEAD